MPWGDLIEQARRSLGDPNFENRERLYKEEIAQAIREVFELAEDGGDWAKGLRRAFSRTYGPPGFRTPYNLSIFNQHQWLGKLEGGPAEEARALLTQMRGPGDAVERFAAFADLAERQADKDGRQPGSILIVGSVLNMATDPEHLPPIKTRAFKSAEEAVGYPEAPSDAISAYPHHLQFLDACMQQFEEADLSVQDRLDAQGILWEWWSAGEPSNALHILQRWSFERDPDTVEKHRALAEEHGVVWWGRLGDPEGRAAIGAPRLKELQAQLAAGTPTYVFLHRTGEVWRTRLVEIRTDRPTDELELTPQYYRDAVGEHHLWLKLQDFKRLEPGYAEKHLVMDGSEDPESIRRAFTGQQSFLYVRLKDAGPEKLDAQRVWWVCQGKTYKAERDGEFIWAPVENAAGQQLPHYESMKDVRVGDVVLHYANTQIRAVGEVLEEAKEATRPETLGTKEGWPNEGRLARVRYTELAEPIALDSIPVDWRIEHGAPFTRQGSVYQAYLFLLQDDFVAKLAGRFPELGLSAIGGRGEGGTGESYAEPAFAEILQSVRDAGLKISEDELRRYHLSLKIRGFVILAGISGSGKTWLTELYAKAIGANHHLEAVAPNWTTNEDLLGYLNPLTESYQYTSFSEFLREAAAEWESAAREKREATPFHVTLDEMNLARVEYYFAKFLSAMEERARYGTATIELAPGYSVLLTPNLRFSGTVNVDETTHVFADKVYDRAQLVTLTPSRDAIKAHMDGRPYRDTLIGMWDAVHAVAPFGYRVLDEIAEYVTKSNDLGVTWEQALDEQLMQKVLPKLKGADQRVGSCLSDLVELTGSSFPLTHAKATAMRDEFAANGFASYF